MTIKGVQLTLEDLAHYSYSVSLEGSSYNVEIIYNDRVEGYFLSLYTADKVSLVSGVRLIPQYPIMLDYSIPGLTGFFWLEPKSLRDVQAYKEYPDRLKQYYRFTYTYSE